MFIQFFILIYNVISEKETLNNIDHMRALLSSTGYDDGYLSIRDPISPKTILFSNTLIADTPFI